MARPRQLPIDRLISLLREMEPEELLMAQGAIRALAPRTRTAAAEAAEQAGLDLGERAAGEE